MTYEMFADIDEDTALLRIFDTANTVMCALCTSQLKPRDRAGKFPPGYIQGK
jgi:hypothetical protein